MKLFDHVDGVKLIKTDAGTNVAFCTLYRNGKWAVHDCYSGYPLCHPVHEDEHLAMKWLEAELEKPRARA